MPDYNEKETRNILLNTAGILESEAELSHSPQLSALVASIKSLNDFQNRFYLRNKQGFVSDYTARDNKAMLSLYTSAVDAADNYLSSPDAAEETKKTVSFLNKILLRDRNNLSLYNADEKKPFHEILNNGRSVTIDLTGKETEKWGGVQSSRIPVSLTARNGKVIEGVFTPERKAGVINRFEETLKKVTDKYPDCTYAFYDLLEKFRNNIGTKINYQPKNNETDIYQLLNLCYDRKNHAMSPGYAVKLFRITENISFPDDLSDNYPSINSAIKLFCSEAQNYYTGEMINHFDLGLNEDERIDSRNSAMSTVAALLGRSDLICAACPMTVKKDGKEIHGTFMEMAKGVDPEHPTEEAVHYNMHNDNLSGALKSIGDLQVIDYICGNVDRHAGNYFYQFEKNEKKLHLKSIVGIDNDSSFGTLDNLFDDNFNRLTGIKNMRCVSESMAAKLESTTPEMLRYALRSYDLSEKSLNAACNRLEHIKTAIKEGREYYNSDEGKNKLAADNSFFKKDTIRILSDADFNNLKISNLAGKKNNRNLYTTVYDYSLNWYNQRESTVLPKYAERTGRISSDAIRYNNAEINRLTEELKTATNWRGTSDNFKAVETAVSDLSKVYINAINTPVDFDGLMSINKAVSKLSQACNTYLDNKLKEKSPSDYAKSRIALVQKISEWADKKDIDPKSLTDEELADLRYNNERNIDNMAKEAMFKRQDAEINRNAPEIKPASV